jgi:hypothetical protein
MRRQRLLHDIGARLERLEQVAMAALKIFQHVIELADNRLRVQREDAADDVVGAGLVGRVEIAGLCRRLEWPHDNPGRVRPQIQCLPVHESAFQQGCLGALRRGENQAPTARSAEGFCRLTLTRES